jgi:hypothetical protein
MTRPFPVEQRPSLLPRELQQGRAVSLNKMATFLAVSSFYIAVWTLAEKIPLEYYYYYYMSEEGTR